MSCVSELEKLVPESNKTDSKFLVALKHLLPIGSIWNFKISPLLTNVGMQNTISSSGYPKFQNAIGEAKVWQKVIYTIPASIIASTQFGRLLSAFATELKRVYERTIDLYTESIPGLSDELLEDWERMAGIPNKCSIAIDQITKEERQCTVHAHFYSEYPRGISKSFYIQYALDLGYVINIYDVTDLSKPFLVAPTGIDTLDSGSRVGDRLNDSGQASVITIEIVDGDFTPAAIARFKCKLDSIKPAHVVWVYI